MALRINPYIILDGHTREAIQFYEKALGAELLGVMSFGDMPENPEFPIPEEAKDRVTHAMIRVGETDMMFSDTFPGQPHEIGNHVTICIVAESVDESNRIFDALSEGGQVEMPMQETFWSPAYGIVKDRFGVTFQVTTEDENHGNQ